VLSLLAWGCAADALYKEHPVGKVVKLLEDMRAQLEKEAEGDDKVMEKMTCWCETNEKEKTQANVDNTAKTGQLESAIEEYDAQQQQLAKELKQLGKDIDTGKAELAEASAIRAKDLAEYVQDEKEQLVSLKGITDALSALTKKLALPQAALLQVQQTLGAKFVRQRRQVQSFLQTKVHTEAPASSEILGILKQMKDDFEANLKESGAEEKAAAKAFVELKTAKKAEINAAQQQSDAKEAQRANAFEKLAESKTDLKDTENVLVQDTAFLADLKKKCGNMDAEFAARKKVRQEEVTAVGEALAILSSDEARDQFDKSLGFIQISSHNVLVQSTEEESMLRARKSASRVVLLAAMKTGSPLLSSLAIKMQADVFDQVKKAIDDLVVELKKEGKDEIKHRDFCIKELNQNQRQTDAAYHQQKRLQTRQEEIDMLLKNGADEIAASNAQITEMQVQLKKATANRQEENADFQMTTQDQRATQAILTKAVDKLKGFYDKKSFVQISQPEGFTERKGASGGAGGVIGMIEGIIAESKAVETDALAAEQDSQAAYEGFVKDTNKALSALQTSVTEKTEAVANADSDNARVKADASQTMSQLEDLHEYAGETHKSCDYTLVNFDARQAARATEIEALNQAKGIVSGAR